MTGLKPAGPDPTRAKPSSTNRRSNTVYWPTGTHILAEEQGFPAAFLRLNGCFREAISPIYSHDPYASSVTPLVVSAISNPLQNTPKMPPALLAACRSKRTQTEDRQRKQDKLAAIQEPAYVAKCRRHILVIGWLAAACRSNLFQSEPQFPRGDWLQLCRSENSWCCPCRPIAPAAAVAFLAARLSGLAGKQ